MTSTPERPPFGRGLPGNRWDLLDGQWPDPLPTVSVIVAHYRQQAELDRTLAALARQTYPAELLEIVVVDDGSPTPPVVPDGVTLVVQEDDGFRVAAARNLGIRSSSGDIVCFLDADTSPSPSYVAEATRLPALAPEAVVTGRRRHADFAGLPVEAPVDEAGPAHELPEPRWLVDAYDRSRNLLDADDRSYRHLLGAVITCSRWFLSQCGGFDESFRDYGGEDWEWSYRAWLAGAVFAFVPSAEAWHDGPEWAARADGNGGADTDGETAADGADARDEEARRRARKNAETLRLADAVPVAGSRGRAVRSRSVDVEIRLHGSPTAAAAFVTVDSLLAVLPMARVVVPAEVASVFRYDERVTGPEPGDARTPPRVRLDVLAPVRVDSEGASPALLAVVGAEGANGVGVGMLGSVEYVVAGAVALRITSSRAAVRERRWGPGLFETARRSAPWLTLLDPEPPLAAYLGGWG